MLPSARNSARAIPESSRIASATLSAMAFRGAGGTLALAILPFGPPNLKAKGTRYFTNAAGPIDRRLIEPVSAFRMAATTASPPDRPGEVPPAAAVALPRIRPAAVEPLPMSRSRGPEGPRRAGNTVTR